jgi:hypothetical protein
MRITPLVPMFALAATLAIGCAEEPIAETPFPPSVPNTTYRVTVHEVYGANDPVALMTFDRDANGNPVRGSIVGKVHGWPFPHADANGDPGEGLFTYRTDFNVARSDKGKLPEAATGVRTIYFHADRTPISLQQPASLASGQAVIRDSVQIQFAFESPDRVEITNTSNQTWAHPFVWQGTTITPPGQPPKTRTITASYSPRYNAYLIR